MFILFYLIMAFVVLGVGIAMLIGGRHTKNKVAGGVLRVIGVLAIILSLIVICGFVMVF